MFADLHLHTHFSDGTYSPEELAAHARRCELAAVALTDHDTVEGCPRMDAACASLGIEFIAATELTAELGHFELHILGYGLDIENARLRNELARYQVIRQNRIREMCARLNRAGIPLAAETVFGLANCKAPGRPHIARALVQAGYCANLDEAFQRYLKMHRIAWVPKAKVHARDAIALIQHAGGVAVMAHPGLNRSDDFIPELVASGLDGIECFHSRHSTATSEKYLTIADRHGLLVTGGSDCHGMNKGRPLIGTLKIPYEHVRRLNERLASSRRARGTAPALPAAAALS
ncbi:MAG: PHP domain-containing protein [Verrucomicrobia bacterium]|nr:PHP domain-containing protein [Verrucomicrobiota bacterium]